LAAVDIAAALSAEWSTGLLVVAIVEESALRHISSSTALKKYTHAGAVLNDSYPNHSSLMIVISALWSM